LQRTQNFARQSAFTYSNPYREDETAPKDGPKGWITEEEICEQIEAIRKQGNGPAGFLPLMEGLKREYFLLKQMEKDTRPGTEREKDHRWPEDVGNIPCYLGRHC
jgi:hypothetical protein